MQRRVDASAVRRGLQAATVPSPSGERIHFLNLQTEVEVIR